MTLSPSQQERLRDQVKQIEERTYQGQHTWGDFSLLLKTAKESLSLISALQEKVAALARLEGKESNSPLDK